MIKNVKLFPLKLVCTFHLFPLLHDLKFWQWDSFDYVCILQKSDMHKCIPYQAFLRLVQRRENYHDFLTIIPVSFFFSLEKKAFPNEFIFYMEGTSSFLCMKTLFSSTDNMLCPFMPSHSFSGSHLWLFIRWCCGCLHFFPLYTEGLFQWIGHILLSSPWKETRYASRNAVWPWDVQETLQLSASH